MAGRFGWRRRGRDLGEHGDDPTPLGDDEHRWWTEGEVVHEPVRGRRSPGPRPADPARPAAGGPGGAADRPVADATPSFAELFSTESLYAPPAEPVPPRTPPRQTRARLASHHPLASALDALGLDDDATWTQIQQAYRDRAKTAHPDRSGDDGEAMAELNATYRSLRDGRRYGLFGES